MAVAFAPEDLNRTGIIKSGYVIRLTRGAGASDGAEDCNGTLTGSSFYISISATPERSEA